MTTATDLLNDRLIPPREAERLIGWADGTFGVKKCRNTLPFPYVQLGRNIRVKLSDLQAYIDANTVAPKSANA